MITELVLPDGQSAAWERQPAPFGMLKGFAMLWLAIAAALTLRAAPRGMPFALTWWSFTFPVGTVVTGTISLAARTGSDILRGASAVLFLLLLAAWLVVAARTAAGAARGRLFLPMAPPADADSPRPVSA